MDKKFKIKSQKIPLNHNFRGLMAGGHDIYINGKCCGVLLVTKAGFVFDSTDNLTDHFNGLCFSTVDSAINYFDVYLNID